MVHLGPGWYLDEKKFAVKVGDTVSATGSKVTLNNQPALIAREVTVNGTTLKLRDDQGLPVWRGMGRGGMGQGMGPAVVRARVRPPGKAGSGPTAGQPGPWRRPWPHLGMAARSHEPARRSWCRIPPA